MASDMAQLVQVPGDGIDPSGARCTAGTSPAGSFRVEVRDCMCRVFRGKSFDVTAPVHPALCSQTGRRRLLCVFPQHDVGNSVVSFYTLYCA